MWNIQLDESLKKFGLIRSSVNPCLYCILEEDDKMLFVTIYVDDFLVFTNNAEVKEKLKTYLNSRFKMKTLGEAKFCLGLRISRDRLNGKLSLDQQPYIEDILKRLNMAFEFSSCDANGPKHQTR